MLAKGNETRYPHFKETLSDTTFLPSLLIAIGDWAAICIASLVPTLSISCLF